MKSVDLVVTPYLDDTPRGVFATRAPARPTQLALSAVRLLEVRGNTLRIRDVDILNGTPLLDIKPYFAQFDCFEVARSGWLSGSILKRQTLTVALRLKRLRRHPRRLPGDHLPAAVLLYVLEALHFKPHLWMIVKTGHGAIRTSVSVVDPNRTVSMLLRG